MKLFLKVGVVLLATVMSMAVLAGCPNNDSDPPLTGTVTITGTALVGQTLTANTDNLGGGTGAISFQWQQGTNPIDGATNSTYTVRQVDVGHTIRLVVTRAGNSGNVISSATLPVVEGGTEESGTAGWISNIDWTSQTGANIGFIVDNLSNQRLVAFAGSVIPANVLGGIPANADNHGIYRDPLVFNRTRAVAVVLVSEEDLITHDAAGTLPALNASPFTSIMVFYNHNMPNNHRHRISNRPGGRHRLIVANPTDYNVEFRINSPLAGGDGVLGFSPRQAHSTVFHLSDHVSPDLETLIFPVFRFFHPVNLTVSEIFPVFPPGGMLAGQARFEPLATGVGLDPVNATINVRDLLDNFAMALDAVWLVVENATNVPIVFFQGNTAMPNSMDTFQVPNVAPNNRRTMVFSTRAGREPALPYLNIGNLGVGPSVAMRTVDILGPNGETNFQLRSDHRYRVVVTGTLDTWFTATLYPDGELVDIQELLQDRDDLGL